VKILTKENASELLGGESLDTFVASYRVGCALSAIRIRFRAMLGE
jgi:hypothetical protein